MPYPLNPFLRILKRLKEFRRPVIITVYNGCPGCPIPLSGIVRKSSKRPLGIKYLKSYELLLPNELSLLILLNLIPLLGLSHLKPF